MVDLEYELPSTSTLLPPDSDIERGHKIATISREWTNLANESSFIPLYLISQRNEPKTLTKRITVQINLPSWVEKEGFTVRVFPGGCNLESIVGWPTQLVDMTVHKKRIQNLLFLKFNMYHPEVAGFSKSLKN